MDGAVWQGAWSGRSDFEGGVSLLVRYCRELEELESRYVRKIREQYGQGFVARGLQFARQRQREYLGE